MKKILISAYAVYPEIASSEGVVNKNWIDIIKKNNVEHILFSSQTSVLKKRNTYLRQIFSFYKSNRNSLKGILYLLLNKSFKIFVNSNEVDSLYQYLWLKFQKKSYNKIIKKDIVVWVRVLPMFSVLPVINNLIKTPIIININDPLDLNNSRNNNGEKILLNAIKETQCWTFPSYKLAMQIAEKYNLDKERCFVIPHAMQEQKVLYEKRDKPKTKKLKFVYTGTFYKSAFTKEFGDGLQKFYKTSKGKEIEFTFILSQYDNASIEWIKKTLPDAKILFKLSREEVLKIIRYVDCMLVVDAFTHQNLLKGKLIEAISFGIPILGISYKNAVMDNVLKEYGCLTGYQEIEDDIFNKLEQTYNNIKDDSWNKQFYIERKNVMQKISEDYIYKATIDISDYAYKRFMWTSGIVTEKPKNILNYNWP
ncbi:glycosyltransferase family protein [Lacinutrix venerupis]|uniref:Uncharacterized protein n=1 Tax=Lacinutrix venerupis TaxID=1486034 RepID=A0AAC9PXB7_9FLAO|nr:hypothetical protein [Lacinutrix venerupis]APY00730.1 hypothetical protein BWR22_10535 [Lacinutrix venerupis]